MSFIIEVCYFFINWKLNIIINIIMRPGDKVLCINDKNWYKIPVRGICEGLVYTLTEVFKCKCGNIYVRLSEVPGFLNMWCPGCNTTEFTRMYFHQERFRKLDQEECVVKEKKEDEVKEKTTSLIIYPN